MTSLKVLVIGAGPTGMTAAVELARLGIPVRLVERAAQPSTTSRALAVQARTLELFAQRGILQPMLDKGNPVRLVKVFGQEKQLFQMDFSHNGTDFPYMLLIPQSETEQILRDELAKLGVTIEHEVEYIALALGDHNAPVTAVLRHKDASVEEVQCEYLIDGEGAHSVTRSTLGLEFQGNTRTESYVLGDVHIEGGPSEHDLTIFSSELGFMGMFPMQGGRFRLIASNPLTEPKPGSEPTLDEIQTIYNQRSHIPGRFHDMLWSSYFRINSRMIHQLHKGRVFLGGDAAHIHSPAGGQGMNTGIQDMINLCWKLAMVIHGKAAPKLVDTYTADRVPVIQGVLEGTEGLTDVIGTRKGIARFALEHFAPWLTSNDLVQTKATRRMSQVLYNYRESPLSKTVHAGGSLHAGDRIPNLPVWEVAGKIQTDNSPEPAKLQALLSTSNLTLIVAKSKDSSAWDDKTQDELTPWKSIMGIIHIAPEDERRKDFVELFGSEPAIILARPDGYAAFVGGENNVPDLTNYLLDWFTPA